MEFDLENPFTSLEQQSDTITDLFATESDHMPSLNLLQGFKTSGFFVSFRQDSISLILRAQYHCNHDPFLPYLAVNYMDRFICSREIPQGRPWVLKLVVISCLSLAAKMKNTHFSISGFQRQEGFFFNLESINRMELVILDGLNWRMRSITPFTFMQFFISLFQLKDPPFTQALKNRATDIVFKSLHEIKLLEFKPSVIAASALLVASHELFPLQFPSFRCSISTCECINKEKLLKCLDALQEMELCESMLDTISSSRTPLSVLDHHCCAISECETPSTAPKRRKINGYSN